MTRSWQELVKTYAPGHALPRELYQGDDLYEAEIRAIFLRSWLCVGHQSHVLPVLQPREHPVAA